MSTKINYLYADGELNNITKLYNNTTYTNTTYTCDQPYTYEPVWSVVVSLVIITITLEHAGRNYGWECVRLSIWLNRLHQFLQPLFLSVGRMYANVIGCLILIDIEDILTTIIDICHPVCLILVIPFDVLVEIDIEAERTSSIFHVLAGTTLAVVLVYGTLTLGVWNPVIMIVNIIVSWLVFMRITWIILDKDTNSKEETNCKETCFKEEKTEA